MCCTMMNRERIRYVVSSGKWAGPIESLLLESNNLRKYYWVKVSVCRIMHGRLKKEQEMWFPPLLNAQMAANT